MLTKGLAEYLAGRNITTDRVGEAIGMPNRCPSNPPIRSLTQYPAWNGWSPEVGNGRLQSARAAGLTPDRVRRLTLKWAFGLPGATQVYGQPSVVAGRVFVAGNTGYVYSLDAGTGCVYWSFQALSACTHGHHSWPRERCRGLRASLRFLATSVRQSMPSTL